MTLSVQLDQINWLGVLPSFGIDSSFLVNRHGPCPVCGGKDRFRFDNINNSGSFFCNQCGAGKGLRLLQLFTGKSSTQLLDEIQEFILSHHMYFNTSVVYENKTDKSKRHLNLCQVWDSAKPLSSSDAASLYLMRRIPGLDIKMVSNHLRCHNALTYYDMTNEKKYVKQAQYPALVARVVNAKGELITLHRTYLTEEGHKAPVATVKKLMRGVAPLKGAAVRLNDVPSKCLAVTEGIETGLAILCAFQRQMNVWSFLSCNNLACADIPFHRFEKVIIFADHDFKSGVKKIRAGEYNARLLAQRIRANNLSVTIRLPRKEGTDFADVWFYHQQK